MTDQIVFGRTVEDADGNYDVRGLKGYSSLVEIRYSNGPILVEFYLCPDTADKLGDALKDAAKAFTAAERTP